MPSSVISMQNCERNISFWNTLGWATSWGSLPRHSAFQASVEQSKPQ